MTQSKPQAALDPAVLDSLSGLALVARTVVEGYMSGQHRSQHRGSSAEFAQHREYVPGDDLRRIDWQVFARTERLVVKEFVEETNLSCHLLVDVSESMEFSSGTRSKLDYARWCAAALAHLIVLQRDAAGVALFDQEVHDLVPPTNGKAQIGEIIRVLERAQPGGVTRTGEVLHELGSRLSRRGIVAIFSDFFDDLEDIAEGVRRLTFAGHEPILFQVLDPMELDFDCEQQRRLDGLEGMGRVKVDPKAVRAAYREEIERAQENLRRTARQLGCDYVPLSTATPLDVALSAYLAKRAVRARTRS